MGFILQNTFLFGGWGGLTFLDLGAYFDALLWISLILKGLKMYSVLVQLISHDPVRLLIFKDVGRVGFVLRSGICHITFCGNAIGGGYANVGRSQAVFISMIGIWVWLEL